MRYQDTVRTHLVAYKQRVLGITEPGIFRYRGRDVLHDHILPLSEQDANVLPAARTLWPRLQARCPGMTRHRYFHHLNSSQALAINLFAPFFEAGGTHAGALLDAMGTPGRLAGWEPEWVPDTVENTNFDAVWWLESGQTILCEVKYTEEGFGTAKADERHLAKLHGIYAGPLAPHVSGSALDEATFFKHYQLLRNVWHLVQDDARQLVLLMPRANTIVWQEWKRLAPLLHEATRDRVVPVALEDVVQRLEQSLPQSDPLAAHIQGFREKYLPPEQAGTRPPSDRIP